MVSNVLELNFVQMNEIFTCMLFRVQGSWRRVRYIGSLNLGTTACSLKLTT